MVVLNTNVIQHQLQNNALVAKKLAEEMAAQGQGLAIVATPTSLKGGSGKSNYSNSNVNNNNNNNNNAAGSGNNSPANIGAAIAGRSSSSLSIGLRPGGSGGSGGSDLDLLRGSLKSQMSFKKVSRFEKAASRVHIGVGGGGGVGGLEAIEAEDEKLVGEGDENMRDELFGSKEKAGGENSQKGRVGNVVPRSLGNVLHRKNKDEEKAGFFSILHTHHTLPVFASGGDTLSCMTYITYMTYMTSLT